MLRTGQAGARAARKAVALACSLLVVISGVVPCGSAAVPSVGATATAPLLGEVELVLYGKEMEGAILERLIQVEKDLFGAPVPGAIVDRIASARTYLLGGAKPDGSSVTFKLAALEWGLTRAVGFGPIIPRLSSIENIVLGPDAVAARGTMSLAARADYLVGLCLPGGAVQQRIVEVPQGTQIRVALRQELNSGKAQVGDSVELEVIEDVLVAGALVVPKGTRAEARVNHVQRAGFLGRDGRIELKVAGIPAVDSTPLAVTLDAAAAKTAKTTYLAVGASVAGLIVLGPVGVVGGLLVQGREVVLPPGTDFWLATREQVKVAGFPSD